MSTSAAREKLIRRLVTLLAPPANEEIPQEDFPPAVDEPYRPEVLQRIAVKAGDLEEVASCCENAGTEVCLEVTFENGSCSNPEAARNPVEEWLQEPNPAWGGAAQMTS